MGTAYGFAIQVDSLGDRGAAGVTDGDYRYAFCTSLATGMGTGLGLRTLLGFPTEIASEADFNSLTTSVGGTSYELDPTHPIVAAAFFTPRKAKIAELDASITVGATSLKLVDDYGVGITNLAGYNILLEQEAIYLSSHSGGGVYTVIRGILNTVAVLHNTVAANTALDTEVYNCAEGPLIYGRSLTLVRYPLDSWTSRVTIWEGMIAQVSASASINVTADSYLASLQRKMIMRNRFVMKAFVDGELSRTSPPNSIVPSGAQGAIPGGGNPPSVPYDEFLISIGGKSGQRYKWSQTDRGTYNVRRTGAKRLTNSAVLASNSNGDQWEFFSTDPEAPDIKVGGVRFGGTPANAITAILQVLTSTAMGGNGSYDVGYEGHQALGSLLGCSIPVSRVDVVGIETFRDILGRRALVGNLNLGFESKEPVNVYGWIKPLLERFGALLTTDKDNKITIVRLSNWSTTIEPTVTSSDFLKEISQFRMLDTIFDELNVAYAYKMGLGTRSLKYVDAFTRSRYESTAQNSRSLDVSAVLDFETVTNIASAYFSLMRLPLPELEATLLADKSFYPGDVIDVTHPHVYDRDGSRGVSGAKYLISARKESLSDAQIQYRMVRVDTGRVGLIAPSAEYNAYTNSGGSGPYIFTLDTSVDYGSQQFVAGDLVGINNLELAVVDNGPYTIVSVSPTEIRVSPDPAPASSTGYLVLTDYITVEAASMLGRWVWISPGLIIGAAADEPYVWVII